jgi:hypothetical protein
MSLTENPEGSYAEEALQKYGYQQEFRRELKRFASFAIGFSFISIIEKLPAIAVIVLGVVLNVNDSYHRFASRKTGSPPLLVNLPAC